jgi:hypothetical protein
MASLAGELAEPLHRAVVEAQAIWFETPAARYLERPEGPVFLSRNGDQSGLRVSGSCYHDLALAVAVGTLQEIGQDSPVSDYTGTVRFATAAGDFVTQHLMSLLPRVRCECRQGIERWRTQPQANAASLPDEQGSVSATHLASASPGCDRGTTEPAEGTPRLSVRKEQILEEMLNLRAFDRGSRVTRQTIVERVNPKHHVPSYRRAFDGLSSIGYTQGEPGADGGIWLTPEGRDRAEVVKHRNDATEQ